MDDHAARFMTIQYAAERPGWQADAPSVVVTEEEL
jgi:hypothetical protein